MTLLKRNLLANYASQIYVTAVGILMVPLYIKYMGAEAYGLVGFFAMLQVWFGLLDVGLTPTMARLTARFQGGASTALEYRRLTRAFESIFLGLALLGCILLFALASPMASGWLKASEIPKHEIIQSLQLVALIVALRWMSGLYRSVVTGAERLVWLSGFNSLMATGRFVLVLPLLMFVSTSPLAFFAFQLAMAIFEFVGLAWMAYQLLPPVQHGQRIQWEWATLRPVLKFSLSIAFTSSVWVFVTQTDKLILSKFLPLADYGYFTLAVLVAGGIMIVSSPISSAIMPHMSRLYAEGRSDELVSVYRKATQVVVITAIPISLLLIFFAPQILLVWTGDINLVQRTAPILSLYAIGYAFLVVSAFPYYLQYAKGDLRLHLIGSALFLLILIPSIIGATKVFGVTGAAWAWLASNFLYFLIWPPLVHRSLLMNQHIDWLWNDVVKPSGLPIFAALFLNLLDYWHANRVVQFTQIFLILILLFSLCYTQADKVKIKF